MATETLWITLPTNEEMKLKEVIHLISSKNLTNLSINQLIEKLENNQAADWLEVLSQYNSIPNNINTSEMLTRATSVKNKFDRKNSQNEIIYPDLKNEMFTPNQLLSLVILCYSNPNLIGPKLCKALNEADETNIKKEMLENSARVKNRVAPWASNLRLLSTALYFNDTDIRLPNSVIERVTRETIRDGRIVCKLDQRGGFEERIDGPARDRNEGIQGIPRGKREIDSYAVFKSLRSSEYDATEKADFLSQLDFPVTASQISHSNNGTELTSEVLPLNSTNNAANSSYANGLIIVAGLATLASKSLVGVVVRNIGKDLATAGKYVGSFFSRNVESEEQQDQKTALLSPTAKS